DNANIQFHIDNLESRRRLGVAADPVAVVVKEPVSELDLPVVHFRMYSNYTAFLKRAEIRVFEQQSFQAEPLAIIPVDEAGLAEWHPVSAILAGPARQFKYLLRAYDAKGNFDETDARPLWLYHQTSAGKVAMSDKPQTQPLLAAYGENDLARQNIPLGSGSVKVQGSGIPAGHKVWVAGREVPVDPKGNFVAEEVLPNGTQTVEVEVLDDAGNGSVYLRDLEFKQRDMFFVGIADMTISKNSVSAAEKLQQGDNAAQPVDSSLDGRLAFYLDSKVEDTAPTLGKFFVKASHGLDYGMWGNFKVNYVGNDLAHVDRGLYGAD